MKLKQINKQKQHLSGRPQKQSISSREKKPTELQDALPENSRKQQKMDKSPNKLCTTEQWDEFKKRTLRIISV